MQKRHFVVKEVDGTYHLKEIEPAIANAMNTFGIRRGEYESIEVSNYFFYFCPMTSHRANEIAEQLSQELLEGKR